MAGGKGTRIANIASDIPKSMIPVLGKPVLEYQLECLKRNKLKDIILVIGHLGDQIKNYFKDGKKIGVNIEYFTETKPLGTAGALFKINNLTQDFLLINGDIIFDMDLSRMISFHTGKKALASIAVHPNSHPYDSALIITDENDQVTGWLNKEDERMWHKNCVNAGVHILSVDFLKYYSGINEKVDLDRDLLKPNIDSAGIYAYSTPEYIKDMGTPDRYEQINRDMENGIAAKKNLSLKQKAVFLDRDGTINKLKSGKFIKNPEEFELIEGAAEAVKIINDLGYLAIIITNQPVIARGDCDFETLDMIHKKMETELGRHGAYIDDIFFCPHHPDKGFKGERTEYKTDCECRKPKPGMLLQAAKKYNIDLSESFMAGDHQRDIEAGINAGCKTALISDEYSLLRFSKDLIKTKKLNAK